MKKTAFERITEYETAVIELERAESLLALLYEEIDEAISASLSKETWKSQYCCDMASISEALATAVSQNISAVKDALSKLIKEER